jgi:hypothetical protein
MLNKIKTDKCDIAEQKITECMYLINTFMLNDNDLSPEEFEIKYKDWKEQCKGIKYRNYASYLESIST